MKVSRPNRALGPRYTGCHGDNEPLVQRSEIESVGEIREVRRALFSEGKRVVAPREAGLEIARCGVSSPVPSEQQVPPERRG